jgi:predicted XRE-type DNA-binding protein
MIKPRRRHTYAAAGSESHPGSIVWSSARREGDDEVSSKRKTRRASHELGSRNVYADLGVPDADEMLIKAQLVAKIASIIDENGYTQPKLSRLLGGHFRGFSERKLMDCLTHLGRDVQIVIRPVTRRRTHGSLSVISL